MSKELMPTELTADQLNHWAAETVWGGNHPLKYSEIGDVWGLNTGNGWVKWSPITDRDHLAMVLKKMTIEQWGRLSLWVDSQLYIDDPERNEVKWGENERYLMLSPPETILRAVYEVMNDGVG